MQNFVLQDVFHFIKNAVQQWNESVILQPSSLEDVDHPSKRSVD